MTLSKSKRQLAELLIAASVKQFPEGANWVAQNAYNVTAAFYAGDTQPKCDFYHLVFRGDYCGNTHDIQLTTLIRNWNRTVLSREEFDQVVEEHVDLNQYCESVTRSIPDQPTLDQLLHDWRNAADYAARKQAEADEAAAMRDLRWQEVQDRLQVFGVSAAQ